MNSPRNFFKGQNLVLIALALIALYLLFKPQTSDFSFCFGGCTGWLPSGARNPNPGYYQYPKTSRNGLQVNYCHCK